MKIHSEFGNYNKDVIDQLKNYMGPEKQSIVAAELKDRIGGPAHIDNATIAIAVKKYNLNPYQANVLRSLRLAEGTNTFGVKGNTRPEDGKPRTSQDYADAAAGTIRNRWNEWTTQQVSGSVSKNPKEHQGLSADRSFLSFLSGDYTPVYTPMSDDHMNRNHEPNMRFFMKEETPESKAWRLK